MYNNVDYGDKIHTLYKSIEEDCITESSILNKIDSNLIKNALKSMKSQKYDSIYNVVSDQYLNAPKILYEYFAVIVKSFLSHGYIPESLLLCTLSPLIKDNLGDITKSDNYRGIAGGCLLLKLIDLVII